MKTKLITKDVMGAYPLVKQDCKRSEDHFFAQYFPISETALFFFGRFTGIPGMMAGETPKCTEENLSHCHDAHLTCTDLVTKPGSPWCETGN